MVDAAADLAQPSPDLPPDVFDGAPADLSPDLARVANSSPDTAADLAPDLAVDYGPSVCGNGVLEGDEGCDDGNEIDDDACTNDCTLPKCGDGITQPNEDCDDGNSSAEDRCTPECHWVPFKQIVGSVGVWALRTNGMLSSFNDTAVLPTDRFSSIAPNRCGIRLDGSIRCWGYLVNSPSGSFKQMDAGNDFACAVRSDGALACWGSPGLPELTPPAGTFKKVAAGNQGVCALRSDGQVLCWGRDPRITTGVPTGSFADISVGGGGCATDSQGAVTCWGISNPTAPGGPGPVHGVVVGYCWACGIRPDGTPVCWHDPVDPGRCSAREGAVGVPVYLQLAAGGCGIREGGTIACGLPGTISEVLSPTARPFRSTSIVAGPYQYSQGSSYLRQDGVPLGVPWGGPPPTGPFSELASTGAVGTVPSKAMSCAVGAGANGGALTCWNAGAGVPSGPHHGLVAGAYHLCALDQEGNAHCWQSVPPEMPPSPPGVLDAPPGPFVRLTAGRHHTCGLRPDGTVACWGRTGFAVSSAPGSYVELEPPPPGQFVEVAAGFSTTCARRAAGNIVCWGAGRVADAVAPARLAHLSVADERACGLDGAGEIHCWGDVAGWHYFPPGPFQRLSVGQFNICAQRRNGQFMCFEDWGPTINGDTPL